MSLMLMGEFGFTAISMLLWSAAAAIPIVIHLLRKRRQLVIPWAAMQMLHKVISQQSRRTRIQQLLLLMLRVLALLLLSFAFARPFLNRSTPDNSNSAIGNRVWILVVDTSYSMGHRSHGVTRLDRAKQYLSEIVQDSQPGDMFELIAMDDPARAIITQPTLDSQSTLTEIQQLSETACGCDAQEALAIALEKAKDCRSLENLPRAIEVVVVSDMGQDAWHGLVPDSNQTAADEKKYKSSTGSSKASGALLDVLSRLGQLATVRIRPIIDTKPVNSAIEAMALSTSRPNVGHSIAVDVTVAAYGQSLKELPVQLEQDGQVVASQVVSVESGSKAQVRFQTIISNAGSHVLAATIPNDDLLVDNRHELVVEATQCNRTLIVQSSSSSKNPWQIALQVDELSATDHSIRTLSELAWSNETLSDYDLIILDNIKLSLSQLDRLVGYVEAGGGVIANWGFNQSSAMTSQESEASRRLLGFDFQGPSDDGDWAVDPLEYRSPIVAPFAGFPNSGLLTTPIFRYWRISNSVAELKTDVSLDSGDPWIVRHRLGKGWIASLLSAPESGQSFAGAPAWNAVTAWPSFLPLAQQLVQTISNFDRNENNFLAGQSIGDRMPKSSSSNSIRLVKPDGSEVTIMGSQASSSTVSTWSYSGTSVRGVYRVVEPTNYAKQFAVNIEPKQSSLSAIDGELYRSFVEPSSPTESRSPTMGGSDDRLARWLLGVLLVVLICETLLAWSLGRLSQ